MNIRPSSSNLHALPNDNDLEFSQSDIKKLLKAPKVSFRQPFDIPHFSLSSSSLTELKFTENKAKLHDSDELSLNVETSAESVVKPVYDYNIIPDFQLDGDDDSAYFTSDDEENAEEVNSALTHEQETFADINKLSSGKFPKILDKLLEKHYL